MFDACMNKLIFLTKSIFIFACVLHVAVSYSQDRGLKSLVPPSPILDPAKVEDASKFGLSLDFSPVTLPTADKQHATLSAKLTNNSSKAVTILIQGPTQGFGFYKLDEKKGGLVDLIQDSVPNISKKYEVIEPRASRPFTMRIGPQTLPRLLEGPLVVTVQALKANGEEYQLLKFDPFSLRIAK